MAASSETGAGETGFGSGTLGAGSFGARVAAERLRQGLTLETVSARTKVNPRHLAAIERGDLLALPGGVFRKGIVRAYLAALGLEEDSWLAGYQAAWNRTAKAAALDTDEQKRTEQDAWATFATNVQRGRTGREQTRRLHWLGVLALFLLLAAAAWLLWRGLPAGVARDLLHSRFLPAHGSAGQSTAAVE